MTTAAGSIISSSNNSRLTATTETETETETPRRTTSSKFLLEEKCGLSYIKRSMSSLFSGEGDRTATAGSVGPSGQDPRTEDTGLRRNSLLAQQPRIRQAGSCESVKGIGASRVPQPSKQTKQEMRVAHKFFKI
jgi:hypothetical protein